jgi:hypothetical protein
MDTPDERRQVHMSKMYFAEGMTPELAVVAYQALMVYFNEHEPKVALAIREGIPASVPEDAIRYGVQHLPGPWIDGFWIDYPDTDS